MRRGVSDDCIVQTLRAANALWRASRRLFRHLKINDAQFNVLNLLADHRDGMNQRQISDHLVVDRSNITLLLHQMEEHGWVTRRDVPGDRRAYRVCLSRAGRELWKQVLPRYARAVEEVVGDVSATKLNAAVEVLRTIELRAKHWPNHV